MLQALANTQNSVRHLLQINQTSFVKQEINKNPYKSVKELTNQAKNLKKKDLIKLPSATGKKSE